MGGGIFKNKDNIEMIWEIHYIPIMVKPDVKSLL